MNGSYTKIKEEFAKRHTKQTRETKGEPRSRRATRRRAKRSRTGWRSAQSTGARSWCCRPAKHDPHGIAQVDWNAESARPRRARALQSEHPPELEQDQRCRHDFPG